MIRRAPMRALKFLSVVLIPVLLPTVQAFANEPWFDLTREVDLLIQRSDPRENVAEIVLRYLEKTAPEFTESVAREGKVSGRLKALWGRSINFDEGAKRIIVPEPTLDTILSLAKLPPRGYRVRGRIAPLIAHAGFEHTYGYLLSNLQTPYGFKRLRWIRPDIEKGFGLPPYSISPTPREGGLFSNLTVFAGSIAFRMNNAHDRASFRRVRAAHEASRAVLGFPYGRLHGKRLTERLVLPRRRVVEIRTDFVRFTRASGPETGGNVELLIYSVLDSNEKYAQLISAFPIADGFSTKATAEKELGRNLPIKTRYNAYVPGVTDFRGTLSGERSVSTF